MSVDPDRVEGVLAEVAVIADRAGRRAYLDQACAGDTELRREVASLLAAHDQAGEFLETPPTVAEEAGFIVPFSGGASCPSAEAGFPDLEQAGERIGALHVTSGSWRPGLDRDEVPGEGPHAAL